jgi:hypothetical protein
MKEQRFYVYAYLDPRKPGTFKYGDFIFDFEPFYIGKGTGRRDVMHRYEANSTNIIPEHNRFKLRKIKKIRREMNMEPKIIRVSSGLTEAAAYALEFKLISAIGTFYNKKGPLTNMVLVQSGNAMTGLTGKLHPAYGTHRSEETRKILSLRRMGMKFSKEHKENLSIARRKRITTPETRRRMSVSMLGKNSKVFAVKSPDGEIYETTNGLTAFCRERNLNRSHMHRVVHGLTPQHKGWTKGN